MKATCHRNGEPLSHMHPAVSPCSSAPAVAGGQQRPWQRRLRAGPRRWSVWLRLQPASLHAKRTESSGQALSTAVPLLLFNETFLLDPPSLPLPPHPLSFWLSPSPQPYLQALHQLLLDGVLRSCVGGHAEPLGCLPQSLLLLLAVWVGSGSLRERQKAASFTIPEDGRETPP